MNTTSGVPATFVEVQQFRQKWIQIIVSVTALGLILGFGYGMIRQLAFGRPWGARPMSDLALAIVGPVMIAFALCLLLLFNKMKLQTEVGNEGVLINFFPQKRQTIGYNEIIDCSTRTYRPIKEFGGWGVRYGRNGKAYTVSGTGGVQLTLKNGKGLLIGSNRPEALAEAIRSGMSAE
jgi:hypothetical protein